VAQTRLETHESGDPDGPAVFYQHGTPASGLLHPGYERSARELGIRLIGYDRAGYGGSARQSGRRVVDAAADLDALADELGVDRFATWGISGGGPHALACAARCSDRLVAVGCLAAPTPYGADGVDWFAGMGQENLDEFGAALESEDALRRYLEPQATGLLAASPEDLREEMATLLGDADREALTGELAEHLLESSAHGLAGGFDGWLDDDLAFVAPWGFELDEIRRPVLLVHGRDDRFVPASHGEWLAERIPGVEARITDDDGHLTLMELRVHDVHTWLLAHLA
jgi:pimeloyl-ACP methyl ester carboxylesterase